MKLNTIVHEANDRISLLLNTNNGKINLDLSDEVTYSYYGAAIAL
jgi:hypothetical protein